MKRAEALKVLDELSRQPTDVSDINMNPSAQQTPYGEQDDNGVDWSLIRNSMKLSPLERSLRHEAARRSALEIRGLAWPE